MKIKAGHSYRACAGGQIVAHIMGETGYSDGSVWSVQGWHYDPATGRRYSYSRERGRFLPEVDNRHTLREDAGTEWAEEHNKHHAPGTLYHVKIERNAPAPDDAETVRRGLCDWGALIRSDALDALARIVADRDRAEAEAKRLREERDEALRNERVALEQLGVECEAKHDWQAAHEAMTEERDALVEQVNYRAETEE